MQSGINEEAASQQETAVSVVAEQGNGVVSEAPKASVTSEPFGDNASGVLLL